MFVLSAIVSNVPVVLACGLPGVPSPERHDLLHGVPLGPDGRAHLLTADDESVCWWTVNEDGDADVHRVWPIPGPHGVAIVVLDDGVCLVVMRAGERWGLLRVEPDGREQAWSLPGSGALAAVRAEGRRVVLDWVDGDVRRSVMVDVDEGRVVGISGRPDASQSPR